MAAALTYLKVKESTGEEKVMPIGAKSVNVTYGSSGYNLDQVLGDVDVEGKGTLQQQINELNKYPIVVLSKEDYDTLEVKDLNTLYFIKGEAGITPGGGGGGSCGCNIMILTAAEYDAITTKDPDTLYFIKTENGIDLGGSIEVDDELNSDSDNPVTNRAITKAIDDVNEELQQVFQSVSSGKAIVASAITDMGISTANDATFETMGQNIRNIQTGGNYSSFVQYTRTLSKGNITSTQKIVTEVIIEYN